MIDIGSMFQRISSALDPSNESSVASEDIERVSAVLLVEIARADHQIDASERDVIIGALSGASSLDAIELQTVVDEALKETDASHSLHEHVTVINARFDKQDKILLVEQMWRVAMADGDIDQYEDYTIRKLCDLLYIKHRDFMQAKHKVLADPQ